MPALRIPAREQELVRQAIAAVQDIDDLGPRIEKQVGDALRAAGVPDEPQAFSTERAARVSALAWAVFGLVVAAAVVWLVVWLVLRIA